MYAAARAVLLLLIAVSLSAPTFAQWYWRHPQPNGHRTSWVSMPSATTGWIFGDGNLPLKTTDGGRTWLPQDIDVLSDGSRILGVAFADESTGLVLELRRGRPSGSAIHRTTDGGATWETVWTASGPVPRGLAVTFVDAAPGLAVVVGRKLATEGGLAPWVLRSTDDGATWEEVPVPETGPNELDEVAFADANHGVALGPPHAEFGGALRTTDGGLTWEILEPAADWKWMTDVTFVDANVGIAVGYDGRILKTTDGGESWAPRDSGTTNRLERVVFRDAQHGIIIAFVPQSHGNVTSVLATTDGGETWVTQGDAPDWLNDVALGEPGVAIATSVYVNHIYRTEDDGRTWIELGTNLADVLTDVAFLDHQTAVAVGGVANAPVGGDLGGAILKTEDGGNTWRWRVRESDAPWSLFGVTFVDQDLGYAVGGDPTASAAGRVVLKTTDGGDHWSDITTADLPLPTLRDISCTDANTCTAVGSCKVIVRTEDGGASWQTQQEPQCPWLSAFSGVHCTDANTCTTVGLNDISRTTDGGETWTSQTTPEDWGLVDVYFVDSEIGFAIGDTEYLGGGPGLILATIDGGETWVTRRDDLPITLVDIEFTDATHGAVVTGAGAIYRTSDGGETWLLDEDLASIGAYAFSFVDAQTAMVVGTVPQYAGQGVVYKTVGGPTFPLSLMPSDAVRCVPDGAPEQIVTGVVLESVGGYAGSVALSTTGEPAGVISELNVSSVDPPGTAAWTLTLDGSVPAGRHILTLTADDGTDQQLADFLLEVVDPASAPPPGAPENGAIDVGLQPTFVWGPIGVVEDYRIQVAADVGFDVVVVDQEVQGTHLASPIELASDTQYFWRVRGIRGCEGAWSEVFSFTTEVRPLAQITPDSLEFELPAGGSDDASVAVSNVGTGELSWTIQTAPTGAAGSGSRVRIRDEAPVRSPYGRTGVDFRIAAEELWAGDVDTRVGSSSPRPDDPVDDSPPPAAMDLATILGEPLSGQRPMSPVGSLVDCDGEPGLVVHDDGTVENGYGADPSVGRVVYVDRLTPSAYPAAVTSVCLAWLSTGPPSLDFEIVVFDDDGPEGGPGTELGALPVSIDGIPGAPPVPATPVWFSFDISSLGLSIDAGSVYVGARWAPTIPGAFIASDESSGNPAGFAGGYLWTHTGDAWLSLVDVFPDYRSLFVRAVAIPGGCADPANLPWLEVTPDAGVTPGGGSTTVLISVDTTGLVPGIHTASLCIATSDAENPLVVVPVSLTVPGPELAFTEASLDLGEVELGSSSEAQAVTLTNSGSLDATGMSFATPGSDFAVDTSACGPVLAAGTSCQVRVAFTPSEAGPAAATVEVSSSEGAFASLDLAGTGIHAVGYTPTALAVDPEEFLSDGNGVLEPGELVDVMPSWRNDGTAAVSLTGTASAFGGPEGAVYTLEQAAADYGLLDPGAEGNCSAIGVCYGLGVNAPATRPATHWEAVFTETLSDDDETGHLWTVHIGESFTDVAKSSPFYAAIETLLHSGVTGGCNDSEYCPAGTSNRAQMAVFLLRAFEGGDYQPAACDADAERFTDVPASSPFCPWIEELAAREVTTGCGGGNYCPNDSVTRAQMAIFLLKTLEGAGYTPPACTGMFVDVDCASPFASWIEELAAREVTGGCSATEFCPSAPVTRAQMAVFVSKAFGLKLYGP